MKYFTSDWHLGHENVIKFSNRPFSRVEEMNEEILSNTISVLKKGDALYHLGDLSFNDYHVEHFINRLPPGVDFHWIIGNHDKCWEKFKDRCTSTSKILDIYIEGKQPVTLCHYPMLTWNKSHYGAWMLYGHHHANTESTSRIDKFAKGKIFNVNVEFNNYKPYSEKDIIKIMEKKENNWDFIKR